MTTLLIVLKQLDGAIQQIQAEQEPAKPQPGDDSILIDDDWYLIPAVYQISIIDTEQEKEDPMPIPPFPPQEANPWWDVNLVMIDGSEEIYYMDEQPSDPLIEDGGWVELTDSHGDKVWVSEEHIQSITANGPYWR